MPRSARTTPTDRALPSTPLEEKREGRERDDLGEHRGTRAIDSALPSQIALRSLGASTSPSITPCSRSAANARDRPSSAVKTIATQSRPVAASSDESHGQRRSGRRRASRRRRATSPAACRAREARAGDPCARAHRRRRGTSCERQPRRREALEPLRIVSRNDEGRRPSALAQLAVEQRMRLRRRARCTARRGSAAPARATASGTARAAAAFRASRIRRASCRASQSPKRSSNIPMRSRRSETR